MSRSFFVVPLVVAALSCGDSEGKKAGLAAKETVGKACMPGDEVQPAFGYFGLNEIGLSIGATSCGVDEYCMAYHFQGRVTCPYGQTQEEIDTLPAGDPARCRVPDEQGNLTSVAVESVVGPQFVERRAEDVVYCSCQCGGDNPDVEYCTCPSGLECRETNPGFGLMFCIKPGFDYDPVMPPEGVCEKDGTDASTDCGNGRQNP